MNDHQYEKRSRLADFLRTVAVDLHDISPALADQFVQLARQADGDPAVIVSPTLDRIIMIATIRQNSSDTTVELASYTTMQLANATVRVAARRDTEPNWMQQQTWQEAFQRLQSQINQRLSTANVPTQRTQTVPLLYFPIRQDDCHARRRRKHGGRWSMFVSIPSQVGHTEKVS